MITWKELNKFFHPPIIRLIDAVDGVSSSEEVGINQCLIMIRMMMMMR